MSILFGVLYPEGQNVVESELSAIALVTQRYEEDGCTLGIRGRVGMGFQSFHTHRRSELDAQPLITDQGDVLTLDGRIDNYEDLCRCLNLPSVHTSDLEMVYAAFRNWGTQCFSKLIGDWALALWSPSDRTLYLARDHAGSRTLYYAARSGVVRWSTCVESLLRSDEDKALDLDYAARYLSGLPIRDKTPFQKIAAVTPAHYLLIRDGVASSFAHWSWRVRDHLHYKSDKDYEDHFFSLFRQSVERRTGSGFPILAQLSGGIDSSSIVCMSDFSRAEAGTSELIDTVSFYDDAEETWDERPYFSAVEAYRGKEGVHIDASFVDRIYQPLPPEMGQYAYPGGDHSSWLREKAFLECLGARGYRVIVSGIGGDEVTGGIPTPFPELANALVSLDLMNFLSKSLAWSRVGRTPLVWLAANTVREVWQLYFGRTCAPPPTPAPWLAPATYRRIEDICNSGDKLLEASLRDRPDSVINGRCWWSILEGLPHQTPGLIKRFEYRYPYLDRDLIDFLFRIPRNQLVRPGQRRSLMKRSLAHILPAKVLERKQKAFVRRGPVVSLQRNRSALTKMLEDSRAAEMGLVDAKRLSAALVSLAEGSGNDSWPLVLRAVLFEIWLRSGVLDNSDGAIYDYALLVGGSRA
jgi:asparagine synthase (glutamine-hydrolysing)